MGEIAGGREAELFAEIEKLEVAETRRFTDLEYRIIARARKRGISWTMLTGWFNSQFGTRFSKTQLSCKFRYENAAYGRGEAE